MKGWVGGNHKGKSGAGKDLDGLAATKISSSKLPAEMSVRPPYTLNHKGKSGAGKDLDGWAATEG